MNHLIFEGAELAGKSWIMSQIYNRLEPKYNQSGKVLDGCHWFNADIGVFGTRFGKGIIKNYLRIFDLLDEKNILVEKFHISDIVYSQIYFDKNIAYQYEEKKLAELGFKIIFVKFKPNVDLLRVRISDRLNLYPHYENILKSPEWYIMQQVKYEKELRKSILPVFTVETDIMPDDIYVSEIMKWIGES